MPSPDLRPEDPYPSLRQVQALTEARVLESYAWRLGDLDVPTRQVMALGVPVPGPEGTPARPLTPWFERYSELEAFCAQHLPEYQVLARTPDAAPWWARPLPWPVVAAAPAETKPHPDLDAARKP